MPGTGSELNDLGESGIRTRAKSRNLPHSGWPRTLRDAITVGDVGGSGGAANRKCVRRMDSGASDEWQRLRRDNRAENPLQVVTGVPKNIHAWTCHPCCLCLVIWLFLPHCSDSYCIGEHPVATLPSCLAQNQQRCDEQQKGPNAHGGKRKARCYGTGQQ